MTKYPFPHDGKVYELSDGVSESVYYVRDKKKYKRNRANGFPAWQHTREIEVDSDTFWMVVACIERSRRHASH